MVVDGRLLMLKKLFASKCFGEICIARKFVSHRKENANAYIRYEYSISSSTTLGDF